MKKSKSSNEELPKKKENAKAKSQEAQKKDLKEKPNQKKEQNLEEETEYYTKEELDLIDHFHELTGKKFEDDEIYDLMVRFKNDEDMITNELKEMLKVLSKGDEYNWTEIGKGEYIFLLIN